MFPDWSSKLLYEVFTNASNPVIVTRCGIIDWEDGPNIGADTSFELSEEELDPGTPKVTYVFDFMV